MMELPGLYQSEIVQIIPLRKIALLLIPFVILLILRYSRQLAKNDDEPPMLPYWIPGLGHVVPFMWSYQRFLQDATSYLGSWQHPYSIILGGMKFHILPDPSDVTHLFRNAKSTSFNGFVEHLMTRGFNITDFTMDFMKNNPEPGPNSLLLSAHDFHIRCLIPGESAGYVTSSTKISHHLRNYFESHIVQNGDGVVWNNISGRTNPIALYDWCRTVLVSCMSDSLYSPRLRKHAPDLTEIFGTFDDGAWKCVYGLPRILAKETYDARDRLIEALQATLAEGMDGTEDIVRLRVKQLRDGGVSERDLASFTAMVYWAANGNIYKVAFWLIISILKSPGLADLIREETASAFDAQGFLAQPDVLFDSQKYPILDGCYKETLRLYSVPDSIRTVEKDFAIGKWQFRKGSCILAPSVNSHIAPELWGEKPHEFDYQRFVNNPKLARHPGYRPFGGGSTQCPGRYLARSEIFVFVVTLFNRYDVKFSPEPVKIPTRETLTVGAKEPLDTKLVKITLERRQEVSI